MILNIPPERLHRYLRHNGPYIFFYNRKDEKENIRIVNNMRKFASMFSKLTVFEIEMKDTIINTKIGINIFNEVFLYFRSKLKDKKQNPNEKEIEEIFEKAIIYYNQNLESKIKKSAPKSIYFQVNENVDLNKYDNIGIKKYKKYRERRKKFLMKNKIIFSDKNKSSYSYNKTYPSIMNITANDNCNVKSEIQKDNCQSKDEFIYKFDNFVSFSQPWFYDVEITDSPTELIFDETFEVKNVKKSNQSKNINFTKQKLN